MRNFFIALLAVLAVLAALLAPSWAQYRRAQGVVPPGVRLAGLDLTGADSEHVGIALNQMFDITTTRAAARKAHPPTIIFVMLFLLALGCALLAGYGMAGGKTRSWIHMLAFGAVIAVTVYVILDIEYPRRGLIRIDSADEVLLELRQRMN